MIWIKVASPTGPDKSPLKPPIDFKAPQIVGLFYFLQPNYILSKSKTDLA